MKLHCCVEASLVKMTFVPYVSDMEVWKKLPLDKTRKFYSLQKGSGVQLVSPEQGVIERAKSSLKRQLNSDSLSANSHSPSRKRRRKTYKPKQKKKTKKKTRKVKKKRKTVKKTRKRKRK